MRAVQSAAGSDTVHPREQDDRPAGETVAGALRWGGLRRVGGKEAPYVRPLHAP